MDLRTLHRIAIKPAYSLLGARFDSPAADVMMMAIARQESGLTARIQRPNGPARSFWQFERAGGVRGVMMHPATRPYMEKLCATLVYPFNEHELHNAMAHNDVLAACMARLLLFSDPRPIPLTQPAGWLYYLQNWRPGKPHPDTWPSCWLGAMTATQELTP